MSQFWPIASAILNGLAYAAGFFTLAFAIFSAIAAVLFLKRLKRKSSRNPAASPAVTVLKPIKGMDRALYENLASFCRQDYADYRIIFTLGDGADPALPVLKRLRQDFPDVPISIVVSDKSIGCNPKINSLAGAEEQIKTDIFIMADSDVLAAPDFIAACVKPFGDPKVGLASCFYSIRHPANAWERLEALCVNDQFLPRALTAAAGGMSFAMGAAIAVRTAAFKKCGGFSSLADYLAEDFILGRSIEKAGYTVAFSSSVIESVPHLSGFTDYLRHQARWARTIRICQPWGYLGTIFLQGFSLLSVKMILLGTTSPAITLAASILIAKTLGTATLSLLCFDSLPQIKTALLLPVQEWLSLFAWFEGWKSTPVIWRGKSYRIGAQGRLLNEMA